MWRIGSLFSGIDGLCLGLEWAGLGEVAFHVELRPEDVAKPAPDAPAKDKRKYKETIELAEFCHARLAENWPEARRYGDVRALSGAKLGYVDVIAGGAPCTDLSSAGRQAGLRGPESGLFWQYARLVREIRPRWVVFENVTSGATRWVDTVRKVLEDEGYATLPIPFGARHVGAPHRRLRTFIIGRRVDGVADADCEQFGAQDSQADSGRCVERRETGAAALRRSNRALQLGLFGMADASSERREGARVGAAQDGGECVPPLWHDADGRDSPLSGFPFAWPPSPDDEAGWRAYVALGGPAFAIRGGTSGLSPRVRRAALRALGNTVVPWQAAVVGRVILRIEHGVL